MSEDISVVLPLATIPTIAERPEILIALLLRVSKEGNRIIQVSYNEIAQETGYANRSGAWKYIKRLEKLGVIKQLKRRQFKLTLPIIVR